MKSGGTITRFGHLRRADAKGSAVRMLNFFAGIDFANTIPWRLSGLPPMQEGICRRSGFPALTCLTASQDRKALLTST